MLDFKALRGVAVACLLSVGLSGCIAAAVPLMFAGMAAEGFMAYKTIQLAGGGSIEIAFPGKDGKTGPVQPIAPVHRVAVWPGDEGDVHFAERLQSSGKFSSVTAPAAVAAILADTKTPANLSALTEQEQGDAFQQVCQRTRADLVFAARPLGASSNSNMFSFSSANITYKANLLGYSCSQRVIVWRDQIALIVKVAGSVSDPSEMYRASSDAWADRVFEAMGYAAAAPKA